MSHKITMPLINKAEIARRLGISRPYVSQLLSGKRKNERQLKRIERLLTKEFSSGKAA